MTTPLLFSLVLSLLTAPVAAQEVPFNDVVAMLRDSNDGRRERAVKMLREAGYIEAAEPIAPLILDPDDDVQIAAIEAEVALFLTHDGSRAKSLALAALEAGPGAMKPVPVPQVIVDNLLTALNDEHERVWFEAVHALGVLAQSPLDAPQIRKLVAGLGHRHATMRAATARVIGRLRVREAEDPLIAAIGDPDATVRRFALYALGEIGSTRAVPTLVQQVQHYRSNTQAAYALFALAKIADPSTADLFRQYLAAQDPSHRAAAAEGLGRVGATDYVPQLEERLRSERGPGVQLAYCFALQKLGRACVNDIAAALTDDATAAQATDYLVELGQPAAAAVVPYLTAREDRVRGRAAQVLGLIGGAEQLPALEAARTDRNAAVARAAEAAVQRIAGRASGN